MLGYTGEPSPSHPGYFPVYCNCILYNILGGNIQCIQHKSYEQAGAELFQAQVPLC